MLKLLSVCAIISCVATVFVVSEPEPETNPFFDAAKSFLEDALEKNSQSGTNSNTGGAAASAFDAILHSIRNSDTGQLGNLLSGLSAAGGKNVAGDVLAGIAGVLGKNSQNFDPKILSQVGGILSSLASSNNAEVKDDNRTPDQQTEVSWGPIFGLVSDLISSSNGGKDGGGGLDALLNLLPLLTGTGGTSSGHVHFADNELEDENEHKRSADGEYTLPPFMRIVHQYWDVFKKSEFGETIWRKSGLEGIFQLFLDNDGYFQVDRIFESMENASFRRKWITSLSSFVGEWFKHLSDPKTQAR